MDYDKFESELESKFVGNREGSSSRTSEELSEVFVMDACALLNTSTPDDISELAEAAREGIENAQENLNDYVRNAEEKLSEAGYTVVWNDGFVIYKELSDEAAEYAGTFV